MPLHVAFDLVHNLVGKLVFTEVKQLARFCIIALLYGKHRALAD